MIVDELLRVLENPDMIRIVSGDQDVYVGYLGTMEYHKRDLSKVMLRKYYPSAVFRRFDTGTGKSWVWMPR